MVYCFNFIECNCDRFGSQEQTCDDNGKCICKDGYEGQNCSACVHGFYQKRIDKVQSLCSGITALYQFGFIAIKAKFIALMKYVFGNYRIFWKLWMLFKVALRQLEIGITYSIFFHIFLPYCYWNLMDLSSYHFFSSGNALFSIVTQTNHRREFINTDRNLVLNTFNILILKIRLTLFLNGLLKSQVLETSPQTISKLPSHLFTRSSC